MITQILNRYDASDCHFTDITDSLPEKFIIKLRLRSSVNSENAGTVIEIPGSLVIRTEYYSPEQAGNGWGWNENYTPYPDPAGNYPVLEASLFLDVPYHPERTELKLGIPLSIYDISGKDLLILYDGIHLRFICGGFVINENFPGGTLKRSDGRAYLYDGLAYAGISGDVDRLRCSKVSRKLNRSIQYYSPAGHSAWAGDVVNYWHDGVYHLFFLYDHHHHGNRWGGGVHYFYHLTTKDFSDWVDHGPIFEIEENWQAFGTGTPFFYEGRFWYAIGYHTGRSIPQELLYGNRMYDDYRKTGFTTAVSHDDIRSSGLYPNGANLAVSDDGGYTFRLTHQMFHWAENPSVYAKDDGSLFMCVGDGIWESRSPSGPWKLTAPGFPPQGRSTALEYTAECPSFFEKNGYKYIIMGLRGYWRTGKNSDDYTDCAVKGEDIYDGLAVPMAVNAGGRLILSGWLNGIGGGSVVVHRELIQYEDGHLGMKWLPELEPERKTLLYESENDFYYELIPKRSYYFEFDVNPSDDGTVKVIFGDRCELCLNSAAEEVQIGPVGGGRILPTYQRNDKDSVNRFDNTPLYSHDFSIPGADCIRRRFRIRIIQFFDRKMNSSILDAEIGGCKTLISNRVNEFWNSISVSADHGSEVSGMRVYSFETEDCR